MERIWDNLDDYWKDIVLAHVKLRYFSMSNSWFGDMQDGNPDIFETYYLEFGKLFKREFTTDEINSIVSIKSLFIQELGISDLKPLKFFDLQSLCAYSNDIKTVDEIANLKNLEIIDVSGNNIFDFTPLLKLSKLSAIEISSNPVSKDEIPVFANNPLVNSYNLGVENHLGLRQEVNRRRIEYLIHFTPTINLLSIFEQGKLLSRAFLEQLDIDQTDIFDYIEFTDDVRFDDKSFINLSIQHPNSFLFNRFRQKTSNETHINWCVLKINKKYIYYHDTMFSVTNAANSHNKRNIGVTGGINKFKQMFAETLQIVTSYNSRIISRNGLKSKYPTDEQAEVLVKNEISIDDILQVCFKDEKDLAAGKAALSDYNTSNFVVDATLFTNARI
jgi:ssDNA thymidine ADP-ribosyltransferase, DarT